VGLHGPNKWAKEEGNQEAINHVGDLEMDFMERRSVGMADHVVSPSRYLLGWMARQGWPPNARAAVQPNVLPLADRRAASLGPRPEGPAAAVDVSELVFFARLETRKGVITFCDAIERLLRGESGEASLTTQDAVLARLKQVTFLGRGAMVHGKFGVHYVQERAQRWPVPWKIIARMGPVEAKAYLREGPRLAVMPSRIENRCDPELETLNPKP
jgi:glycosyltransferase involved in cell wall biosynthesis